MTSEGGYLCIELSLVETKFMENAELKNNKLFLGGLKMLMLKKDNQLKFVCVSLRLSSCTKYLPLPFPV
jgi:hypothetical protein